MRSLSTRTLVLERWWIFDLVKFKTVVMMRIYACICVDVCVYVWMCVWVGATSSFCVDEDGRVKEGGNDGVMVWGIYAFACEE